MRSELEKLYHHIDDIEIAMMTTRRPDAHLQSRAMATQKREDGADLWFVTLEGGQKLRDIAADPHINLRTTRIATASGCPCRDSRASRAIGRRSTSCMPLTGRHGSRRKVTRGTALRTTRAPNTRPPAELVPDPAPVKKLKLLWLSVGNRDPLQRYNRDLHTYLQEKGVAHSWRLDTNGHDTAEMSSSLYHFAQKLFKE